MKNKVLSIVMTLLFMISGSLSAQTAYAVFCEGDNSLHFLCSDEILEEGATLPSTGQVITKLWSDTDVTNSSYVPRWGTYKYEEEIHIANVVFEKSFKTARPQSCCRWFFNFVDLKTIEGIENLNTSNVTNMSLFFYGCKSLTTLNLSKFDTSNVTDMLGMFNECRNLILLDISNFDTSKVTDMGSMFDFCMRLTALDLSNFNMSNVTDMRYMFAHCEELKSLNLSKFGTSNMINMAHMFQGCSSLTSLDLSNFDTSNVTYMGNMFQGCKSLTSLDLSNFNTSNVTSMGSMFAGCNSLTSLDVSKFNTSNVTSMGSMFGECSNLTSLDVSNFDTSNVTSMGSMFWGCRNLTFLDVSNFNTSNVTDMGGMFWNCVNLKSLNVSHFDTSNVTSMGLMFHGCSSLTSLDVSHFNTSNVTLMSMMFESCVKLTFLDVSHFDTSNVTNMLGMFRGCESLPSLNLSNFNTSNVTDMRWMFFGCSSLTSLDLSNFDMSNVQDMADMFNSIAFRLIDLSKGKITNSNWHAESYAYNAALIYVPEGTPVPENRKNIVIGNKCEHLVVDYDKKNGQLLLSVPYEFTADKVTINRDFIADTPQTLYLPFEISSTAYGTFYTYGGYNENDGSIKFNKLNAANTTANRAYLFKPNSDGAIEIEGSVAVKKTAGAKTETTSLNGIYEKKKFTEDEIRKGVYFELKDGEFVRVDDNTEIDACQAYMMLSNGNAGDNLTVAYSDATGISDVSPDGSGLQAPAYNINGQRVDSSYKGVVIRNGKKMIVK